MPGRCPACTPSQEPSPFTVLSIVQAKLQGTLQHIHIHLASVLETDLHRGWLKKGSSPSPLSALHSTAGDGMAQGGDRTQREDTLLTSQPKFFLGKVWFEATVHPHVIHTVWLHVKYTCTDHLPSPQCQIISYLLKVHQRNPRFLLPWKP